LIKQGIAMTTEFEDKYLDVLQNIEWGLLQLVPERPELCDHDMLRIIEQAVSYYKTLERGHQITSQGTLDGIHKKIFGNILSLCDWRVGRTVPPKEMLACSPITLKELVLCLKRIEKSIKFWTRMGGRKGYITFAAPRALVSSSQQAHCIQIESEF
jgi:hypothetical protein